MSFQDLNPTPTQVGSPPPTPATYTQTVQAPGATAIFTQSNANVFIAQGLTENCTVTLPSPSSPTYANLVMDSIGQTGGNITVTVVGNGLTVVLGTVGQAGIYWNGSVWTITSYDGG